MKEVLKNFQEDTIGLLAVLLLLRLWTPAARALLGVSQVGFGGFGVFFHVNYSCGWDPDRDLQLCLTGNRFMSWIIPSFKDKPTLTSSVAPKSYF